MHKSPSGPKSPEGKAKVSQNRTVHGLCRKFCVLPGAESQEQHDAFLNQLMDDEKPVGQAEIEPVLKMAEHTWLSKRALYMQGLCFVTEPTAPKTPPSLECRSASNPTSNAGSASRQPTTELLNKCVYTVLGVSLSGKQEVLGLSIEETDAARFWLKVFNTSVTVSSGAQKRLTEPEES